MSRAIESMKSRIRSHQKVIRSLVMFIQLYLGSCIKPESMYIFVGDVESKSGRINSEIRRLLSEYVHIATDLPISNISTF